MVHAIGPADKHAAPGLAIREVAFGIMMPLGWLLVLSAILGWMRSGDVPLVTVLLGAAMVLASWIFIVRHD